MTPPWTLLANRLWCEPDLRRFASAFGFSRSTPPWRRTLPHACALALAGRLASSVMLAHKGAIAPHPRRKAQQPSPPTTQVQEIVMKALSPHARDTRVTHGTHTHGNSSRPFLPQSPTRHICPAAQGLACCSDQSPACCPRPCRGRSHYWGGAS